MFVFEPRNVAFGRHETFPLRYGWLPKGLRLLERDPSLFDGDDATVHLGVGRNMVSAIKYWLRATGMAERTDDGLQPTELGRWLFGVNGADPYIEDEATIWLLHWLLASNAQLATGTYWFFNHYHSAYFGAPEVNAALTDFIKEQVSSRVASSTVKNDVGVLMRMYVPSRGSARNPMEEALDSPMATLGLITKVESGRSFESPPAARPGLHPGVIGFAVAELFESTGRSEFPLEYLLRSRDNLPAPGAVFRLTESNLLTKLEQLLAMWPGHFELRETAGIHQLYRLSEATPMDCLAWMYKAKAEVAA
jgi:hypothetical protein